MIKSQHEVLQDLKAMLLSSVAMSRGDEFQQGYLWALLAVATQWDVEKEFVQYARLTGNNVEVVSVIQKKTEEKNLHCQT